MDRGVSNNSGNDSFIPENMHPSASAGRSIGTTHPVDAEEAFVIDVLDDVADLIGVCLQHHHLLGLAFEGRPSGSIGITLHFGGSAFQVFRPDILTGHLKTGGGGSFEKFEEKIFIGLFHMPIVEPLSRQGAKRESGFLHLGKAMNLSMVSKKIRLKSRFRASL